MQTKSLKKSLLFTAAVVTTSFAFEAAAQIAVEEITVTARKREESLLEIPIAVSAFSQNDLDAAGINNLEDLASFTPGFEFQSVGAGGRAGRQNPNIRFRGIGVQQANPASRGGAVFWEGGYISDGAGILPLIDLERVEVIKGPQVTFYGRNTFAGAINYIPAEPGDEFSGKGSISWSPSDEDSYNITAAVGGPITDEIGVRVAFQQERVGADFNFDNGDPAGEENTTAVTLVTTYEPTESLKFKLSGFYVDSDDTRQLQGQSAPVAAGDCDRIFTGNVRDVATGEIVGTLNTDISQSPRATFCGEIPDWDAVPINFADSGRVDQGLPTFLAAPLPFLPVQFGANSFEFLNALPIGLQGRGIGDLPNSLGTTYKLWRVDLSADYDFEDGSTLHFELARGESSNRGLRDGNFGTPTPDFSFLFPFLPPSSPGAPWLTGITSWVRDTYGEVRYSSSSENPLRYSIGASYYQQGNRLANYGQFGPTIALNFQNGEVWGIFGSVDYDVTDEITISLEGRFTDDTQTVDLDGQAGAAPEDVLFDLEQNYSRFMPRAIISYQPMDNLNLYASWSKSNLQGIFTNAVDYEAAVLAETGDAVDTGLGPFTPIQTLTSYEIGIKHAPMDWLNYSIAAYFQDWKNQAFFDLSPSFVSVNLPGDSEIKGIESEISATPVDWLNFTANATFNDVEFTDFGGTGSIANAVLAGGTLQTGRQIDSTGLRPRYIPKWTGSFSATFFVNELLDFERAAFVRWDGIYTGQFYVDNFEWNSVSSYWKFNVRAGLDVTENLTAEFYVNNLTNDLSWTTAGGTSSIFGSLDRKTFGPLPSKREIGFRVSADF